MLPAVSVHGTYDFVLFAIGGLNSVYGIDTLALDIISLLFPISITIGGALWAYNSFKQVSTQHAIFSFDLIILR